METVTCDSTEIAWDAAARVAKIRYTLGITLTGKDGVFLAESLDRWVGKEKKPFGILADAKGLKGTDAEYRSRASAYFRQHRATAAIALINLGPVIAILVDMFRIGTGVRLKAFPDEEQAAHRAKAGGRGGQARQPGARSVQLLRRS
jgi:hypothetical protein